MIADLDVEGAVKHWNNGMYKHTLYFSRQATKQNHFH